MPFDADNHDSQLPDETHRALRVQTSAHGRSMEAEVRDILERAARPDARLKLGTALVALFRPVGGVDLAIERDQAPGEPASFE